MTGWHLDDDMLRRYVERTDSLAEGASAEQHLLSCEPCRARVTVAASVIELSVIDFAAVWDRTRDAIEVPRPSVFERLLRGAGLPAQEARLVAVASAFRGVWLVGVAAVLVFAALAAALGHARGVWLFLAVAPIAPCLVVASSYDPRMDPALEPELVTPYPALRLILLRTIAVPALPPSQGRVSVLGLDPEVPAERTGIRRQLGYQPQEVGFPRGFTAFAFVDYIALLKEWTQPTARHAEVRRVLDLVGLSDLGPKRIRAMSGGQRRRVALAQALLGSPAVLILDEPTTGVDPEQRVTLRTVLAEIARTSVVVLSTHQTEDVAALCERVIVLDRGRVRYDGPVTELTGQAAGRVWLADEPDPEASVSWRTGTGRYRNVGAHVRDDVEHVEPSLEDAYLLLRGGSPQTEPAEEVAS